MTDDALGEIRKLRERLARLEAMAAPTGEPVPQPTTLAGAVAAHYAGTEAGSRALDSWGPFHEDPAMERTIAARAAHPDAYGPPDMAEAIYTGRKQAAADAKGATE